MREHRTECEELHRELNERDAKFEECVEHFQQKIDVSAQNTTHVHTILSQNRQPLSGLSGSE